MIKPFEDRIVLRKVDIEQVTSAGVIMPTTYKVDNGMSLNADVGEVVERGPGTKDISMVVPKGAKVWFRSTDSTILEIGEKTRYILPQSALLGYYEA